MIDLPFTIFPVGQNKAPLIPQWQSKATRDPRIIERWSSQGASAWGIPCGAANNLFVIDLDVDKTTGAAIGAASLQAMPRYADLLKYANVRTPSSGSHIYCQHFEGARNTTSKIGPKIDTRGTGGYVIAPSSLIASGHYCGHIPQSLPPVPLGLRALLLHQPQAPKRSLDRLSPTGEVEELLSFIPPDVPYQEWLQILMALHDRFNGTAEGLALAEQWSAGGSKYRPGEVATKWGSFKGQGVTWASIPALARTYGADLSAISQKWVV